MEGDGRLDVGVVGIGPREKVDDQPGKPEKDEGHGRGAKGGVETACKKTYGHSKAEGGKDLGVGVERLEFFDPMLLRSEEGTWVSREGCCEFVDAGGIAKVAVHPSDHEESPYSQKGHQQSLSGRSAAEAMDCGA